MKSQPTHLAALVSSLFIFAHSTIALADQRSDTGLYASLGVGVSTIDSDLSLEDDTGFAPRAAVGWQLTPNLGIEGSYHNFEEAEDPHGTLAKFDMNGASLAGTVRLPLSDRLALFAKLGNIWWESDLTDTNCSRGPAGCTTAKYSADDSSLFFGIGMGYEITSMLELELYYDNIESEYVAPLLNVFDHDTSVLGASLKFKF